MDLLKQSLTRRNKDKKELCLTLAVINRNIEDWFNEDNKLYSYKDSYSVSELRKALGTKCRIPIFVNIGPIFVDKGTIFVRMVD